MKRIAYGALLAGVVLAIFAIRAVADAGLAGNWTVNLLEQGKQHTFWLIKLEEKGGKLTGASESADNVPSSTIDGLRVDGDLLHFTIKVRGTAVRFPGQGAQGGGENDPGLDRPRQPHDSSAARTHDGHGP